MLQNIFLYQLPIHPPLDLVRLDYCWDFPAMHHVGDSAQRNGRGSILVAAIY